jgi:uncharacterized protein (TIGR03905 family)
MIQFDIEDGKVKDVSFEGGCNGNLKAIGVLVDGMDARECVQKLKNLRCGGRQTSCGDQLAAAIEGALKSGA